MNFTMKTAVIIFPTTRAQRATTASSSTPHPARHECHQEEAGMAGHRALAARWMR